jgi:5-methylcytosine-specific restriction enzyme subunit McrC
MQNIIYEYQEVQYKELENHVIETPLLHKYFKLEWKTLKARQYCGILSFNSTDYYNKAIKILELKEVD